jgi:hypothetical protein
LFLSIIGSRERCGSYLNFFWNFKHSKFSSPDPGEFISDRIPLSIQAQEKTDVIFAVDTLEFLHK